MATTLAIRRDPREFVGSEVANALDSGQKCEQDPKVVATSAFTAVKSE
jgi:hypothetical protein